MTRALPEHDPAWVAALQAFEISGLKNNIAALHKMLRYDPFRAGTLHTGLLAETQVT